MLPDHGLDIPARIGRSTTGGAPPFSGEKICKSKPGESGVGGGSGTTLWGVRVGVLGGLTFGAGSARGTEDTGSS